MASSERITLDPAVRSGKPCIRGARITVRDVVEYLAGGMSVEELLVDFPSLRREDVESAVAFHLNENEEDRHAS
jgi:uncharacterized protein (DUF433 family)